MKLRSITPSAKSSQTLIVTLAVLVVVTIAIASTLALVELDSHSTKNSSEQNLSSFFAINAVNLIEGDLKQEIISGSTLIPVTNSAYSLYYPTSPANMMVARNTTNIVNLIRCSYASDHIASPGLPSMASSVNSYNDPSNDGQVVTPAAWNAHYLIPRTGTPTDVMDSTPTNTFVAPDWVYVIGDGNRKVITTPDNTAVGRYAYAIYDEGGLLDANVVGMPSTMGASQVAEKNSAAFADLTKIPNLSLANIDNLVGWRNYYTTQPSGKSGSFPSYSITSTGATNYYNYLNNNATNGFLVVNSAPIGGTSVSDQSFPSRQALISYCRSAGISMDALQYLATHTRDLNQPSYIPNPNRPLVVSPGTYASGSWVLSSYLGGNDGQNLDNTINPPFLSITATSAFTRNDGSIAVVGEPLVKKRFDLRRLAWLTYQGPSSQRTLSDPDMTQVQANGVTAAFLNLGTPGTAGNVYKYFGLTWNGQNWVYNHGSATGAICKLVDVQALKREPDFFELLKAAIDVGSVGKSCAYGSSIDTGNYQHQIDISVDNQIIQIGANIMDQSDADGYPTDISFNGLDIYGVENLPYLYRTTYSWVYNSTNRVSIAPAHPLPSNGIETNTVPSSLLNGGEADFYLIPHMWNMCDQNDISARGTNYALGNPRPGADQLQITATSEPPGGGSATNAWQMGFELAGVNDSTNVNGASNLINYYSQAFVNTNAVPSPQPTPNPLLGESLTYGDANGSLFREPTMLWRQGYPAGSDLTSSTLAVYDVFDLTNAASAPKRVGFYLNSAPVAWTYKDNGTNYITEGRGLCILKNAPGGSVFGYSGAMTYLSQYKNSSGGWQTYDARYWDLQAREPDYPVSASNSELNLVYVADHSPASGYNAQQFTRFSPASSTHPSPADTGEYGGDDTMGFDCRSDRWGLGESSGSSIVGLDYTNITIPYFCVNPTDRPGYTANDAQPSDIDSGVHIGNFEPGGALPTPLYGTYSALFYDTLNYYLSTKNPAPYGMWSQNSPWASSTPTGQSGGPHHCFNADADGVVRRAMGAYVPVSTTSPSTPAALGLPMAIATSFDASGVGSANSNGQSASRPIILNRPFQAVSELSYVFSGTPFKNLDFTTPESGYAALLDVFCVGDVSSPNGLEAGKVNLNTRQKPVLQALLSATDIDDPLYGTTFSTTEVNNLAASLNSRTTNTNTAWLGPLTNLSDLVGRYIGKNVITTVANPPPLAPTGGNSYYACNIESSGSAWGSSGNTICYSGYSADLDGDFASGPTGSTALIERKRQSAIRALTTGGQVRVWNLLIDIYAQTGVFPPAATTPAQFTVQGQSHYWVHVSIDRNTGQIIDSQSELVQQ